ncbi:MAG: hypothetical protein WCT12_23640 [Verrucomicrobiota bacterium]
MRKYPRKSKSRKSPAAEAVPAQSAPHEASFREVVRMIQGARARAHAYYAVNTELMGLYWRLRVLPTGHAGAAPANAKTSP